jgi:Protein of unknown function (DUF2889)
MAVTDLGAPRFELHPLHGIHEPTQSTPRRRPRSVRRTTSIDMTRDVGAVDPVYLSGRGRDLWTGPDGSTTELAHARLDAMIELAPRIVRRIETEPMIAGISQLVGAPAISGFRAAADKAAPQLRQRRDLLYTLFDDIPVATLISGLALSASGVLGERAKSGYLPMADQCAGFVTGGPLLSSFQAGDPAIPTGPIAPNLDDDDPHAWHPVARLPTHGMRRRRRLDVYDADEPGIIGIDAMFRDTYVRADDQETIIHEYTVEATADPDSGVILQSRAIPRVLPWQECPGAVDSATRLAGMSLADLHFRVRKELAGITTCTHLNDLLRSVADAAALIPRLRAA